jgi:hypothetical protein
MPVQDQACLRIRLGEARPPPGCGGDRPRFRRPVAYSFTSNPSALDHRRNGPAFQRSLALTSTLKICPTVKKTPVEPHPADCPRQ